MKRTGNSKIAVVGWGRGMGHKGHMYLADAVITQATNMKADPYFFVSKTVGKDDPVFPEEKVRIYQKVFPQYAPIFTPEGNLNQALQELAQLGYQGVVVVVGADQKKAFQYLEGNNKEGVPVYQSLGLKKLRVISRQETNSKFANEEGPRATPMREILLDPNASEEDKFNVWRRDMPEELSDREVLDIMNKAESRLVNSNAPKVLSQMSKKATKLKEAIMSFKAKKSEEQGTKMSKTCARCGGSLFRFPNTIKCHKCNQTWKASPKTKKQGVAEGLRGTGNPGMPTPYDQGHNDAKKGIAYDNPYNQPGEEQEHNQYKKGYEQGKKQDVAEGSDPYTDGYNAWTEYLSGKTNRYPKNPYPAGKGMSQWEAGAAKAAEGRDFISGSDQGVEEASGVTRRGILKGIAGAGALGAAGKASGIAGAFPTPSQQQAMYKAAADSNAAQARADAAAKAKADAERLKQGTADIERLNKINFHGGKVTPINATWDGDSDFMDVDGTKYSMASRMPIRGDEPGNMKLVSTKEGRLVYMWTRNSLKGVVGRYFYPAPVGTSQINEFAPDDSGDNGQEDMFFKYAKMWYNGNLKVQQRVEEILAQAGWEIGEIESEEGGVFIVQSGDENGDTYMGWSAEDLGGQLNEFAPNDGGDSRVPMHFVVEKELYNPRSKWKKSYNPEGGGVLLFTTKEEAIQAAEKFNRIDKNREFKYGGTQMAQVDDENLNEFAPGNGDDGLPYAEYQVYQCNPLDQFDWIGGPLYQTDNMGMAHKYAYEQYIKHRPKAFMIWQERSQGSRGNYGVKGESDSDLSEDYVDEK